MEAATDKRFALVVMFLWVLRPNGLSRALAEFQSSHKPFCFRILNQGESVSTDQHFCHPHP